MILSNSLYVVLLLYCGYIRSPKYISKVMNLNEVPLGESKASSSLMEDKKIDIIHYHGLRFIHTE